MKLVRFADKMCHVLNISRIDDNIDAKLIYQELFTVIFYHSRRTDVWLTAAEMFSGTGLNT